MWIEALGRRWPWPHPTVRLRLTALYGALFLFSGALLLLFSYVLVRQGLNTPLAVPLPSRSAPASAVDLALYERTLRRQLVHLLLGHFAIAWGVMAIASAGLGWWVAGRALRPVQRITATARRLTETNLHERIALSGPRDELREMADTFDAVLDRLEAAFEGQRRFVANASHELRTPLTVQRTLLEVALDNPEATPCELRKTLEEVVAVTARSERLIDNLLVLARSARGLAPHETKNVDLAAVVRLAIEQEWHAAGHPALALTSRLLPATVDGVRALLGHLAANLIRNAIRHNHVDGWVEVVTETVGGRARLTVRNSGPVVPSERLDAIFEPFTGLGADRTDADRGSGLGLSIVRAVAETHGATLMAVALPAGGLTLTVEFPPLHDGRRSDIVRQAYTAPAPGRSVSLLAAQPDYKSQ